MAQEKVYRGLFWAW